MASPPHASYHGSEGISLLGPDRRTRSMRTLILALLCIAPLLRANAAPADQVAVRYAEGVTHGYLALRTHSGTKIADGELTQVEKDGSVTLHLTFKFKDGSLYDDTVVFTQHDKFRLVSDHVIQKGPAFKTPLESSIDAATGEVRVQYTANGKPTEIKQKLTLPPDLANGLLPVIIKDVPTNRPTMLSLLAFTPKPRLVKLSIAPQSEESFLTGGSPHKAMRYLMKIKIGGIAGLIAPLFGKQPPDTQFWVVGGDAPSFVGSEGPLTSDGPVWRMELVSPSFQQPQSQ